MREADATLYNLESWIATEAAMCALEAGETIYSREKSGFLKCTKEELLGKINSDIKKIYDADMSRCVYVGDSSLIVLEDEGEDSISITLLSTNNEEVERFVAATKENLEKTRKNTVSVLTSGMDGFYLTPIGTLDAPLVRENYSQEVVNGFDFAVRDLQSSNPFGRLVIINGPPGTGKTYLIRGIINELANSTIVLIPAKMIAELDGPSLLPTFISHKKRNRRPITLIVEDADTCLALRMNDYISSINSLLNYTDGILGTLLDLKIIATTNQEKIEFDDALTRTGRISRHLEINELSAEKASEIYKRLTDGDEIKYDEPTVLSDVYADAKLKTNNELIGDERDPNFDPDPGRKLRGRKWRNPVGFGR